MESCEGDFYEPALAVAHLPFTHNPLSHGPAEQGDRLGNEVSGWTAASQNKVCTLEEGHDFLVKS